MPALALDSKTATTYGSDIFKLNQDNSRIKGCSTSHEARLKLWDKKIRSITQFCHTDKIEVNVVSIKI
jgi:hypothetical protein